ncbi:PREDICTED: 2-hydroxyisoflavanone dehydratase-like isoform X2 [Nelumbo nucifera]|uniref:2-hydroxyisoflavanone dehydratase-like isoform X2 n=1 Tax=Nelumbo nucifera TaxID=4432 RepID=A0A1U8BLF3_NELNU|nr:PREDICTED: 2-hydroxyisoflavanone dehydratase-like isoform X2 [Nelumbo nucifera]
MDSGAQRVSAELPPLLRVYEDGLVERLVGSGFVPATLNDPQTGVSSKDVLISPESAVSARLYLPKLTCNRRKLPILVYFRGGAFCIESAFSFLDHRYLNILVNEANVVAVFVEYRRAPEHLLPVAYDDCWAALEWVSSHSVGRGANYEPWLTDYADFDRIFLGGDSAGGNIVHNVAMRARAQSLPHNGALQERSFGISNTELRFHSG